MATKLKDSMNISIDIITATDKALFAEELSVLLKSGMSIGDALETIGEGTKKKTIQKIVMALRHAAEEGTELSKALSEHPRFFSAFFVNMVKIGEESGTLVQNLVYIAATLKKEREFNSKVKGALMYPIIILILALVVAFGVSIFVLPKLTDLFDSLAVDLPWSTRVLMAFAQNSKFYGLVGLLSAIAIYFLTKFALLNQKVRYNLQFIMLRVPVFSGFVRNYQLASLCRNMSIMLKSGLPIGRAFEVVRDATSNEVFKSYILLMHEGVTKGQSLEESIEEIPERDFPSLAKRMIGVGEKSGTLSDSFAYLAEYFEEATDAFTKNFATIIEPVILVMVGLAVAFLAMAIVTPIYDFTSSVE